MPLVTTEQPQHTIAASFTVEGEAVFTGGQSAVTLHPADENSGIVFVNADAGCEIPVCPANAVNDPNHSTLALPDHKDAAIHLVEHVLSALHGLAIDNAVVEVKGGECPLLDGSAAEYAGGIAPKEQGAGRRVIELSEKLEFTHNDSSLVCMPADEGRAVYSYDLYYPHPMIGGQQHTAHLTSDEYRETIAPARTFIPIEEAEQLIAAGHLRSTDDARCIVIYPDRYNTPLYHPTEFAAHKILDLVGDLYLCGYPVIGTFVAKRSGHTLNHRVMHRIMELELESA